MKKKATDNQNLAIPYFGMHSAKISSMIKKQTKIDLNFEHGSILGSMCTRPPKFALKNFIKYNDVNLGDPGLFPGSVKIEKEAIKMLSTLLNNKKSAGVYVTGGTEANILAIRTALLLYLDQFSPENKPARESLKLLVPQSAHFSFDKAAQLMGVQIIKIELNDQFRMDIDQFQEQLDDHCFAVVGVAGSTGLGTIDSIAKISDICLKRKLYLHIDAAFGGFVIPFMDDAFKKQNAFDFSLPGVCSITIDPHKMGRGVTPGGVILYKDQETAQAVSTPVTYLAGGETRHLTLVGTRSGAAVISCYASMLQQGMKGYEKTVKNALQTTQYLVERIETMEGYRILMDPVINVVGIVPDFCTADELGDILREQKIAVSVFKPFIRVVMMPHVTRKKIRNFCNHLTQIYKQNKENRSHD